MDIPITFSRPTVKTVDQELQAAFRRNDLRRVKRITAWLSLAAGSAPAPVAARRGRSRSTGSAWLRALLVEGGASWRPHPAPGRPAKLTPTPQQRRHDLVPAGPEAAGCTPGCWTSALLQDLIQRAFGQRYHVHSLSALLRNLGFSDQQARCVSAQLTEAQRQQGVQETWPAIVQAARRSGALLRCGDAASFAQWGALAYTWALRGQPPVVKPGGKRKGSQVCGLIDDFRGRWFARGHPGRCNAERDGEFLELVLAQPTQPLMGIQDGARSHTAAKPRECFAQPAARLTVQQLPSYAPDDNPIEHLWRTIKRHNTHNRYFPEFSDLTTAVETALAHFQQHPQEGKQLMGSYLDEAVAMAWAA